MSGRSVSDSDAPGDICQVNEAYTTPDTLTVGERTYFLNKGETLTFQGHQYLIQYRVGQHKSSVPVMSLIDCGAHGCVCGDDMTVLKGSKCFVDVRSLGGHWKNQLHIVTAQALIETHKGNVIAIFHHMALLGKVKSILLCLQMEHYGAFVNDKSLQLCGGQQCILRDGYQIPLTFHNGLCYLS
jgi:hypothetical protein